MQCRFCRDLGPQNPGLDLSSVRKSRGVWPNIQSTLGCPRHPTLRNIHTTDTYLGFHFPGHPPQVRSLRVMRSATLCYVEFRPGHSFRVVQWERQYPRPPCFHRTPRFILSIIYTSPSSSVDLCRSFHRSDLLRRDRRRFIQLHRRGSRTARHGRVLGYSRPSIHRLERLCPRERFVSRVFRDFGEFTVVWGHSGKALCLRLWARCHRRYIPIVPIE